MECPEKFICKRDTLTHPRLLNWPKSPHRLGLTGFAKRGFSVNPIVDSVFPWGCMLIGNKFWSLHVHSCFLFQTKYTINYVCTRKKGIFFFFNLNNSFKFFAFQMFHIYNYSVNLLKLSIFAHILKKSQLFLFPPLEASCINLLSYGYEIVTEWPSLVNFYFSQNKLSGS